MITRIAFTLLLLTASAQAAEITILSRTPVFVLVDGQINPTDNDKFIKAVRWTTERDHLPIQSGRHLRAGVMIGVGEGDWALGRICCGVERRNGHGGSNTEIYAGLRSLSVRRWVPTAP